ncbi:MAG: hypothetical protein QY329_11780 [Anaerolineales bacterium]|nr:MAG: hypothetical protein QY329_11780 [Anaerolineales bacterium]
MDSTEVLLALFLFAVFGGVMAFAVLQSRARSARLTRQAEKRGGEIRKGSLWRQPELRIPFKDAFIAIRVIPGSRYSPPKTVAQIKLDSPRLPALRLTRNFLLQKMLAAFGRERLLTGDGEFDRLWTLTTEDGFAAQKLATPDFKAQLEQRLFRSLVMDIRPQEFSFAIGVIPSNDEALDVFIDTVVMVLNKFL